ncbi:hypothetical protein [Mycobacteroides abscessus]|uniref:hypothetical protein n=1 Tax=Mycobacteroides abscessus TaxID=36809 RepID=UPI00092C26AD|nr:hypothetical protein [Mycobacteroides abscessus]MDM2083391.1 hypothetical protein [Mycobacteroides abscessus]MDM2088211.1 hypothetical protein [Mycobacteroides abscessus]MDO3096245.1 hypothetical protein [Mycobacteroides abscessus subsp. abscessus]SHS85651.1 Uncharacterised protein [Mycobacteroides abscessus subsp. abscessus]SHT98192.1 Uncharacterised protein [Mycobacteroides abscessus subsp. abscessus]
MWTFAGTYPEPSVECTTVSVPSEDRNTPTAQLTGKPTSRQSCHNRHANNAAAFASGDNPRTARSGSTALTTAAGTKVGPTFPAATAADPVGDDPDVAAAVDDEPTGATPAVAPDAAGAPIPGDGNNGNELVGPPAVPAAVAGVTIP